MHQKRDFCSLEQWEVILIVKIVRLHEERRIQFVLSLEKTIYPYKCRFPLCMIALFYYIEVFNKCCLKT